MRKILLNLLFFIIPFVSYSQVRAFLDTNVIGFADQTVLHLQVKTNKNTPVAFPEFKGDSLYDFVEIVKTLAIDTVNTNPFTIEKKYVITSFEDSIRNIPSIPVLVGKDTIYSNPLRLYVVPLHMDSTEIAKLDTTQMIPVFNIKNVYNVKFTFKEFWLRFGRWILLALILITLIAVIVWLIIRYKNNKPIRILEKPSEPAHLIALRRLAELKAKKLFENDKIKEFYSELIDILRTYVEQRFGIYAMERTSIEIIADFDMRKLLEKDKLNDLRSLLMISDLAKFAKHKPTSDIGQQNFDEVKNFVEQTKQEQVLPETEIQKDNK